MKFVANLDYKNGWIEEFDTEEEAIARMREVVEWDVHCHFAGTTNWTWQSKQSKTKQVKWVKIDEQGRVINMSKVLRIKDYTKQDEYRMEGREYLLSGRQELLNKWDEIVSTFR